MAIPLSTTTITVRGVRPQTAIDPDSEGYDSVDQPAKTVLAVGVRASITSPNATRDGASQEDIYALRCDPTDLVRFDEIVDDITGWVYEVQTVSKSHPVAYGLQHLTANIKLQQGLPS